LLFSISYRNDYISLTSYSVGFLSLYIIYLSFTFNANNISNTILILSGIVSFLSIELNVYNDFYILIGGFDVIDVVLLTLIPQVLQYIELKKLNDVKWIIFIILLAIYMPTIIFNGLNIEPHIFFTLDFIRENKYTYIYSNIYILSFLFIYLLIELSSRLIWSKLN